ncbi:MAG: hypothetical protein NDJ19_01435 [Ramlibacter sp.]|nr:hypothetical protein [Ramlibacter sp.]
MASSFPPQRSGHASHPFALAALVMVLTFGLVFAAVLTHQLLARQHRLMVLQAHPAQELRSPVPDAQRCPALYGRMPDDAIHRGRRALDAAHGCPPGKWT